MSEVTPLLCVFKNGGSVRVCGWFLARRSATGAATGALRVGLALCAGVCWGFYRSTSGVSVILAGFALGAVLSCFLQILKSLVPGPGRVPVLWSPATKAAKRNHRHAVANAASGTPTIRSRGTIRSHTHKANAARTWALTSPRFAAGSDGEELTPPPNTTPFEPLKPWIP